jgi:hypothetical protein
VFPVRLRLLDRRPAGDLRARLHLHHHGKLSGFAITASCAERRPFAPRPRTLEAHAPRRAFAGDFVAVFRDPAKASPFEKMAGP